jgi:hypothetical protein
VEHFTLKLFSDLEKIYAKQGGTVVFQHGNPTQRNEQGVKENSKANYRVVGLLTIMNLLPWHYIQT